MKSRTELVVKGTLNGAVDWFQFVRVDFSDPYKVCVHFWREPKRTIKKYIFSKCHVCFENRHAPKNFDELMKLADGHVHFSSLFTQVEIEHLSDFYNERISKINSKKRKN